LKWNEVDVDVVAECTGFFTTVETANEHIKGGAKKVLFLHLLLMPNVCNGSNHTEAKASDLMFLTLLVLQTV
jgi:glyceraldehyde 3-phosphate dehydrogenase